MSVEDAGARHRRDADAARCARTWSSIGRATLINDAYNANPGVRAAAIELLGTRRRRPAAGRRARHDARAGRDTPRVCTTTSPARALDAGVEIVAGIGEFAMPALGRVAPGDSRVVTADDVDELVAAFSPRLAPDAVILLKASRGVRLERLVRADLRLGTAPIVHYHLS